MHTSGCEVKREFQQHRPGVTSPQGALAMFVHSKVRESYSIQALVISVQSKVRESYSIQALVMSVQSKVRES